MMPASGTKFCAHKIFFTLKVGRAHPARIAQRRCLPPLTPGAASLESSEGARCRECRILRQASALVAGPQKSCKTTKILCAQCVDAVEPIASAKKVLSTPRVLNDLYSMSRNPTGESST